MDFFDALSWRVSSVNTSRDFRSHLEQHDALVVSPARAQTHHRSYRRFLLSDFEKAVKKKMIFFLCINSVWTESVTGDLQQASASPRLEEIGVKGTDTAILTD